MGTESKRFLLFGMGSTRRKLLYCEGGRLLDALTLEPIRTWQPVDEAIDASAYRVECRVQDGLPVTIEEDEEGVWLEEAGERLALTQGQHVCLPSFEGSPHAASLRALHGELLVNLMPLGPVPNLWVYPRPWYRDAAMMLMCLAKTGNLGLVEAWVMGLHKIWDRNNGGEPEADNLGQALFMLSLFASASHPLVRKIVEALPAYHRNGHIAGRTDYVVCDLLRQPTGLLLWVGTRRGKGTPCAQVSAARERKDGRRRIPVPVCGSMHRSVIGFLGRDDALPRARVRGPPAWLRTLQPSRAASGPPPSAPGLCAMSPAPCALPTRDVQESSPSREAGFIGTKVPN